MAGLNGMGPFEEGARTGRGLGRCNSNDNDNRGNFGIGRGRRKGRGLANRYGFSYGRGFGRRMQYNDVESENYESIVQERDLLQQKLKFIEDGLKKLGSGQD